MAIKRYRLIFTGNPKDDTKVYNFFNRKNYKVEIFDHDGYATLKVHHSWLGFCEFHPANEDDSRCVLTEIPEGTTVYRRTAYKNGPYVFTYE